MPTKQQMRNHQTITVGDQVLVRQERKDKFSTPFNPTPYSVVSKTSNSVIVEAPGGTPYSRNTSHVKRFIADDPVSTPGTPSASPDGIVVPSTIPSQVLSELKPAAPSAPQNEPPIEEYTVSTNKCREWKRGSYRPW